MRRLGIKHKGHSGTIYNSRHPNSWQNSERSRLLISTAVISKPVTSNKARYIHICRRWIVVYSVEDIMRLHPTNGWLERWCWILWGLGPWCERRKPVVPNGFSRYRMVEYHREMRKQLGSSSFPPMIRLWCYTECPRRRWCRKRNPETI